MSVLSGHSSLQDFLQKEPAATIAVPVDKPGTIHAASLLYAHTEMPLRFYFVTSKHSEKCRLLKGQTSIKAACVIGTTKGTMFTLQMRGKLEIVDPVQFEEVIENYYLKRGNRLDDIQDPKNVLLEFTPTWARFTDYSKGYDYSFLDLKD